MSPAGKSFRVMRASAWASGTEPKRDQSENVCRVLLHVPFWLWAFSHVALESKVVVSFPRPVSASLIKTLIRLATEVVNKRWWSWYVGFDDYLDTNWTQLFVMSKLTLVRSGDLVKGCDLGMPNSAPEDCGHLNPASPRSPCAVNI